MKLPFDKLIYHSGMCFGPCSVYHLQLDSDKSIKLHREFVFEPNSFLIDKSKSGFFKGVISETQSQNLEIALESFLASANSDATLEIHVTDLPEQSINIYVKGKILRFKYSIPPDSAGNLLTILKNICEDETLERSQALKIPPK